MKNFMFRKVEIWAAALVVLALLISMFIYGVIVRETVLGSTRFGPVGRASVAVSSLPAEAVREVKMLLRGDLAGMSVAHAHRFPGKSGWYFYDARLKNGLDGYILFSRHDGDAGHHVLELVDLKAGKVVHRIDLDASHLLAKANRNLRFAAPTEYETRRFLAVHPLVLENGDILLKGMRTPLFRMTPCGETVWIMNSKIFHHTIEPGPDGNFWTSAFTDPQRVKGMEPYFQDPNIVEFSADGKILYDVSLTKNMLEQGLGPMILGARDFDHDPMHLNDVQPVFADGPYWKRGDVFLSFRHLSMIMLFRPSTRKVIWWKQGPWAAQHDVDVINDTTIGVFDNNAYDFGKGPFIDGQSRILYYDFATKTVRTPIEKAMVANDIRNEAAGLFRLLPGGHYFMEETESGRTLVFGPKGELEVENINRAKNGLIFALGWSRYMDRASGDRFLAQLKAARCK